MRCWLGRVKFARVKFCLKFLLCCNLSFLSLHFDFVLYWVLVARNILLRCPAAATSTVGSRAARNNENIFSQRSKIVHI